MAEIAIELNRAIAQRREAGLPGTTAARTIAGGDGWTVADVICTSGPSDRPFEERHERVSVAIVVAGTFQHRSAHGRVLMTPGSVLLGSPGQCYQCGHEHATGDRCVAFWFSPEYFERLARDAGLRSRHAPFARASLPPLRDTSAIAADACAGLLDSDGAPWEELGVELAASAIRLAAGLPDVVDRFPPNAESRVTAAVREIERHPNAGLTLSDLASAAGLSAFHFLRVFERLTGLTPHQYVRRARLRLAAARLAAEPARVLDVALDCGFGDVSNFNRAFRSEFGTNPRGYRAERRRRVPSSALGR